MCAAIVTRYQQIDGAQAWTFSADQLKVWQFFADSVKQDCIVLWQGEIKQRQNI